MDLNNNCCKTYKLQKVKELYISNVDEFTLYKCPDCQTNWLYRKIEESWMDKCSHISTKKSMIVEISPNDIVWGCGCFKRDAQKPELWRGKNLLGHILMKVREDLRYI